MHLLTFAAVGSCMVLFARSKIPILSPPIRSVGVRIAEGHESEGSKEEIARRITKHFV